MSIAHLFTLASALRKERAAAQLAQDVPPGGRGARAAASARAGRDAKASPARPAGPGRGRAPR